MMTVIVRRCTIRVYLITVNPKIYIMNKQESVTQIMTSNVMTANTAQPLYEIEQLMTQHHIRHVPVVSGEALVGMLSLTDLLRISFADSFGGSEQSVDSAIYDMLSIKQVMVNHPISVDVNTTIKEVAEILSEREFHALPVTQDGKVVGIVTTTDLIRHLLAQYN